jgi:hypothetical protein
MAIRMMIGKEEAEALNFVNVDVVTDYPGSETWRVCHHWDCPHSKNRQPKTREELSIVYPDCVQGQCKHYQPLYMRTTHHGLVLETREYNGYDDSDFYAIVWNPEKGCKEQITYASTRGWTYPNNAVVDATPEVLAAVKAFEEAVYQARVARIKAAEAKIPSKGKKVRVVKGRKVGKGIEGVVFWMGRDPYQRDYSCSLSRAMFHPAEMWQGRLYRIGIQLADGTKVFTSADNVEVIVEAG